MNDSTQGCQTLGSYDQTIDRKLQIFQEIMRSRHTLSPEEAAIDAEKVFQKLCIPQAPSA